LGSRAWVGRDPRVDGAGARGAGTHATLEPARSGDADDSEGAESDSALPRRRCLHDDRGLLGLGLGLGLGLLDLDLERAELVVTSKVAMVLAAAACGRGKLHVRLLVEVDLRDEVLDLLRTRHLVLGDHNLDLVFSAIGKCSAGAGLLLGRAELLLLGRAGLLLLGRAELLLLGRAELLFLGRAELLLGRAGLLLLGRAELLLLGRAGILLEGVDVGLHREGAADGLD